MIFGIERPLKLEVVWYLPEKYLNPVSVNFTSGMMSAGIQRLGDAAIMDWSPYAFVDQWRGSIEQRRHESHEENFNKPVRGGVFTRR
jgi:hypothetical protein